jgi:virginiamycin B lyase
MSQNVEIVSNFQQKKFALKVRHNGPQPSIIVRTFSAITSGITTFPLPTQSSSPGGITAGPDGNLWFTESATNKIGRITPGGSITEFRLIAICGSYGSCGPDGNLWFTEFDGNAIGRITPSGSFSTFGIPTANSRPEGITAGPDGNVWFTEENASKIGRITTQ